MSKNGSPQSNFCALAGVRWTRSAENCLPFPNCLPLVRSSFHVCLNFAHISSIFSNSTKTLNRMSHAKMPTDIPWTPPSSGVQQLHFGTSTPSGGVHPIRAIGTAVAQGMRGAAIFKKHGSTDVAMKIDGRTMIMKSGHHTPDLNSPAFKSESARSRAIWNYPAARGRNWDMATILLADTDMTPSVLIAACSVAGESADKLN